MADRVDSKTGRPEGKKPVPVRRKRRIVIAALCLLAVGAGTWLLWRQPTKPEEITLDLGNNVKMRLVLIPAGKSMMGSPDKEAGRESNEGPQHGVTISKPFYMGVFDVTQEQYEQVMGTHPSHFKGATNPVECVSWHDAAEFCRKLSAKTGKRVTLPTETQWEYACRAGTTTPFNTGDEIKNGQANADIPSNLGAWDKLVDWVREFFPTKAKTGATTAVGSFPPNSFGLYDMHGNVWEWCADWYGEDYYANSPKADPQGPATGTARVLRGGSWIDNPGACRSAYRHSNVPDLRSRIVGFRVVISPGGEKEP